MLENLLSSLKSEIGDQIAGKTQLPPDKLDNVFSVIGDETKRQVSQQMSGDGISGVMNLFSRQPNSPKADQLQSNISLGIVGGLMSKLGLSKDVSENIAQIAVPKLVSMITNKNSTTPDDDPSPLHDLFGEGIGSGLGEAAKGVIGKFMK